MGEDENDALAYAPNWFSLGQCRETRGHRLQFRRVSACRLRVERQVAQRPAKVGRLLDEFLHGRGEVLIASQPSVESLASVQPYRLCRLGNGRADVWRARYITNQIAQWERAGRMPRLVTHLPAERPHERHERRRSGARSARGR